MNPESRQPKKRIIHDPGWVVAGGNAITDVRAHLRGVGVVQPPLRYPNQKPRLAYTNSAKREGTSPNMLVTYATGEQAVIPAHTRASNAARKRTNAKKAAQASAATEARLDRKQAAQERLTATLAGHAIGNVD